jgi:cellulose synthase/poly-beta-1,6-N-acetylglucosamine synthase-like glycosyltransferase
VPAHNESAGLLPTLGDIKAQMRAADRLLVVADNCTDDTAAVAIAAGAEVAERKDLDRRGKGYALAWGLSRLSADPPEIVIIVDADCRLASDALDRLAGTCAATRRPVQALYLMITPDGSQLDTRVAEFAWRVKNWGRPLGLKALGLPCQLMGTGMAFPWEAVHSADLASGSIVEDMKLGFDLALAGHFALFYPSARVTSDFPSTADGTQTQRLRWEQGHIGMILTAVPRLILAAATRTNIELLALALDAAVPPLSLLGMLVVGMTVASGLATLVGVSSFAMWVSTASLAGFICASVIAWLRYGRDILPPSTILSLASYATAKIPLYIGIFSRKSRSRWIRTERRKS